MTRLFVLLPALLLAAPSPAALHTCRWTFQDGSPQASDSCSPPVVSFSSAGAKRVSLTVCAGGACTTIAKTLQVLDPRPRILNVQKPSTDVYPGDSITLSAGVSGQPPLALSWTFPGGASSENPVAFTAPEASQASVSLSASNQAGSASLRLSIPVRDPRPRASIRLSPSPLYVGQTLVAQASATGKPPMTYRWTLSPEGVSGTSPTFTWSTTAAAPGTRRLELTATNSSGTSKVSSLISLKLAPLVLTFQPVCTSLCFFPEGSSVPFETLTSAPVERYEYDWNGDGRFEASSASPVTSYSFPKAGSFRPRVRVTSGPRVESAYCARLVHISHPK